jgi:hypothetical protein
MSDVKEEGSMLVVNIRPLKTDKGRKFVIVDDDGGIPYVQLFKSIFLFAQAMLTPTEYF